MSRPHCLSLAVLVLSVLFAGKCLWQMQQWHQEQRAAAEAEAAIKTQPQEQVETQANRSPLPGDAILKNYASPSTRPQEDLEALAHTFSNLLLLVKGDSPFRMGANEEFAAALRGKNRAQLRFLSDTHRAFNAQGQLMDRWDTPLYFHALARDRVDIRSAGPDRQMWTSDDIHRHYDGSFLKGEALNPDSLFQETEPGRPGRK